LPQGIGGWHLPQSGTQRVTATTQAVENHLNSLWILGGKPVHDTICWGEQTGKLLTSLIRRRFVPALSGTLTTYAKNTAQVVNAN
jgi:hypothetical protein